MHEIGVKEKYQGLNIGDGLLENAVKYGKSNEVKSFELGVWEFDQDSIAFYEKMGFKTKTRRMELEL